jgi:mono/diheme cytochrome c family protein
MRSGVLSGALGALVVVAVAAFVWMYSGAYDVSATRPHGRVTRWILSTAAARSIQAHAKKEAGIRLPEDEESLQSGYAAYDSMCVPCHGAPGVSKDWLGKGMSPEPPDLQAVARERKPEEIYWVVKNGIKSAGMPALAPTHDESEVLEVSAFVKKLGAMSPGEYADFRAKAGNSARKRQGMNESGI